MGTLPAPCAVVFDLDGTLIDSAPDIHATVNAVLRLYGIAPLSLDQVRGFIGGGVDLLWRRVLQATGLPAAMHGEMLAAFMTRYHHATALTRIYPHVPEILGVLADLGHPLGICTNKPLATTRAVLDHFGLGGLFSAVIGGDSLPQRKPDPEPLRAAFAMLGADRAQPAGVYVGDSEYDAFCARDAGVPFLLFTRGYCKLPFDQLPHHARFADFSALPGLVADLCVPGGPERA